MPFRRYEDIDINDEKMLMISYANEIIDRYGAMGYDLTLRQLYYQFVQADLFPDHRKYVQVGGKWKRHTAGTKNADPNYNWLGDIVRDARLAGLMDWDAIVDRTRSTRSLRHWNDPAEIVSEGARNFRIQKWGDQPNYVEVWIEKDALIGIVERACTQADVDVAFFSCRGYSSSTAIWEAAQRLRERIKEGHKVTVLYLGDHDPSGMDMTRDIRERLTLFLATDLAYYDDDEPMDSMAESEDFLSEVFRVKRIALSMAQIRALNPPPNPTKFKDSRAKEYVRRYGRSSWELDAIQPEQLVELIVNEVRHLQAPKMWARARKREEQLRGQLQKIKDRYPDVLKFLEGKAA